MRAKRNIGTKKKKPYCYTLFVLIIVDVSRSAKFSYALFLGRKSGNGAMAGDEIPGSRAIQRRLVGRLERGQTFRLTECDPRTKATEILNVKHMNTMVPRKPYLRFYR